MAYKGYGGFSPSESEYCVYHERQLNDSNLCAVHCANNLLQYPYFDVQTCLHFVSQLKEKEKAMLMQGADANFVVNDNMLTEYVSADGNYSIEVIRYALGTDMFNLSMHRWGKTEEELAKPHELDGFICHFKNHWIAIRKLYGQWYDMNSLSGLPETLAVPCTMSDFYLSAHLSTLKEQGYSIFAVTGKYPPLHPRSELIELEQQTQFDGKTVHTIKVYNAKDLKSRDKTYPKNLLNDVNRSNVGQSVGVGSHGGSEEYMLQQAMAASMQGNNNGNNMGGFGMGMGNGNDHDADLQKVLAMSMMGNNNNNNNNNGNHNSNDNSNGNQNESNDNDGSEKELNDTEMLEKAMFMSMQGDYEMKVPKEPEAKEANRIEIQFRLINGTQTKRAFLASHTLDDVSNYVKSVETINVLDDDLMFVIPPRDNFDNLKMKLSELGGRRVRLIVKRKEKSVENKEEKGNDNSNDNESESKAAKEPTSKENTEQKQSVDNTKTDNNTNSSNVEEADTGTHDDTDTVMAG